MGVLPLQFLDGDGWQELGLGGSELFAIKGMSQLTPHKELRITARKADASAYAWQTQFASCTEFNGQTV